MVDHPTAILESAIAVGFRSAPLEDITVTRTMNGATVTNINRPPLRRFEFNGASQSIAGIQALNGFKQARRGQAYSFLLKDWADYQLTSEVILTAAGSETTVQAIKAYGTVSPYSRTIKYLKTGWQVFVDAVERTSSTDVDGLITFSGAALSAGEVVTLTGEFYVPVRFTRPYSPMAIEARNVTYGRISGLDCEEILE